MSWDPEAFTVELNIQTIFSVDPASNGGGEIGKSGALKQVLRLDWEGKCAYQTPCEMRDIVKDYYPYMNCM